jgi:hypothetical protein
LIVNEIFASAFKRAARSRGREISTLRRMAIPSNRSSPAILPSAWLDAPTHPRVGPERYGVTALLGRAVLQDVRSHTFRHFCVRSKSSPKVRRRSLRAFAADMAISASVPHYRCRCNGRGFLNRAARYGKALFMSLQNEERVPPGDARLSGRPTATSPLAFVK